MMAVCIYKWWQCESYDLYEKKLLDGYGFDSSEQRITDLIMTLLSTDLS